MIQPDEIIDKAQRLYPKAVAAILEASSPPQSGHLTQSNQSEQPSFFPYRMPCNLKAPESHAELIRQVERLRQKSKAIVGYGYSVQYQPRRSRDHGENEFPEAIFIETMQDLVKLIRKSDEYRGLMKAVELIRVQFPQLESWIQSNWRKIIPASEEIPHLLAVTQWLIANPRPNCFPREIPLAISTKLVETNWALLASWWDLLLAPSDIDYGCDPRDYAQRYGFRWVEPHLLVRLLDPAIQQQWQVPFVEFSVPARRLGQMIEGSTCLQRVFILENKVNQLTLPAMPRTIALGGLGFGVTQLHQLSSLSTIEIIYWGDLDVEGFQVLSTLRSNFPRVRSWLMDRETLDTFHDLTIAGNNSQIDPPIHLTSDESTVFHYLRQHNLRLEQERIPQKYVLDRLALFVPFCF